MKELKENIEWAESKLKRIIKYEKEGRKERAVAQKSIFESIIKFGNIMLQKGTYHCPEYKEYKEAFDSLD